MEAEARLGRREKKWFAAGAIAVLWIGGAVLWSGWHKAPTAAGSTDADYQAAANVMFRFDGLKVGAGEIPSTDTYVAQLKLVKPKCTETLMQVVDLFEDAASLSHVGATSIQTLTAYNATNSKRVGPSPCRADVALAIPSSLPPPKTSKGRANLN